MPPALERSLQELAEHVGGTVEGDASIRIRGVAGLEEAGPGLLSFYGNARYRAALRTTRAAAVLLPAAEPADRDDLALVRVASPHLAFARILTLFHPAPAVGPGVSPRAEVDPSARVDASATIMAFAVVAAGASVGPRTVLWPGVFVGAGARIGADCQLQPNAVVREGCVLGDRVVLQPGAVVGSDGFGFAFDPAGPAHVKVPQIGIVRIEDDVELGAGTCVDRATTGETVIGRGSKLDNLVQVAHNVRVGPLSILCAQAGISGSTELGTGVVLAGQVGVVGHVRVGDGARVAAQSGVAHDVPDGVTIGGTPAIEMPAWLRQVAAVKQLPDLLREFRALRARVAALESSEDPQDP